MNKCLSTNGTPALRSFVVGKLQRGQHLRNAALDQHALFDGKPAQLPQQHIALLRRAPAEQQIIRGDAQNLAGLFERRQGNADRPALNS